jgi:small subunit ribosomal protein S2
MLTDINTDNRNQEENQGDSTSQIEEMYRAGVHFGYSSSSRHPKMESYLFGVRNNVEVFNLEVVLSCIEKAAEFLKSLGEIRKSILLVATKAEAKDFAEKAGREIGMPYVTERWLGGTLTNFKVMRKNIDSFEELCRKRESGELSSYIKKELVLLDKQLAKQEKKFGGLRALKQLPSAVLVVDSKEEDAAVKEAKKIGVPVVALLNSDCDPRDIDYPVPGNDASTTSIKFLLDYLIEGYKEGLKVKPKEEKKDSGEKNKKKV